MIISFTIPDDKIELVVDAFVDQYEYQETIDGEPNSETKAQFTKRMIIRHIKRIVKVYELEKANAAITITDMDII